MSTLNWGSHGVVTTEEAVNLFQENQRAFEIWTVQASTTGVTVPVMLSTQLASSFREALQQWAMLEEKEEFFDSLSLTYNGLPLVESRSEATQISIEFNKKQV